MIILPCIFGGFGNNLHQIGNCFTFFLKNKIDLNYLRIIPKYEDRYNSILHPKQSKDLIFKELTRFFIGPFDYKNRKIPHINFSTDIKNIILENNYIYDWDFGCQHKILYEFLNIKKKQDYIKEKYNFNTEHTICIHIRRGDLKPYMDFNYYLNIVLNNIDKNIWVMTDDISYCKDKLSTVYDKINYFYDMNINLEEEFLLGSICKKIYSTKRSTLSYMLRYYNEYYYS